MFSNSTVHKHKFEQSPTLKMLTFVLNFGNFKKKNAFIGLHMKCIDRKKFLPYTEAAHH